MSSNNEQNLQKSVKKAKKRGWFIHKTQLNYDFLVLLCIGLDSGMFFDIKTNTHT